MMCADTPILSPTPLVVALSKALINQVNVHADNRREENRDNSTSKHGAPSKKTPTATRSDIPVSYSYILCYLD